MIEPMQTHVENTIRTMIIKKPRARRASCESLIEMRMTWRGLGVGGKG